MTDDQYMGMARLAREHADCKKSQVGAVIVLPTSGVILGANGSPIGQVKCVDGGCYRCSHPELFPHGKGYDVCTCVHAEEDCLAQAARYGFSVAGGKLYCTLRPCRGCSKQLLQAGIVAVYYENELPFGDKDELAAYLTLQRGFRDGVHPLVHAAASVPIAEVRVAVTVSSTSVS